MRERNSFDSLRLVGSLVVLIGHAFIITGASPPSIGTIPLHSFGVCIFFTISGFLITQSWMSDGNWTRYLLRRILRIEPALIVVVTVTALLIGALATTEPLGSYYRHGWTWRYVISNSALITVWGLPGVFDAAPIHGQANGSLWTLPIEFGLYLATPLLTFIGRRHGVFGPLFIVIAAFLIFGLNQNLPGMSSANVLGIDVGKGIALIPYFWLGAALRVLDVSGWSARARNTTMLLAIAIFLAWICLAISAILPIGIVSISLLVITIGLKDWLYSDRLRRIGDLSYGIYLWSFPIQQFSFLKFGGGPGLNIAICMPTILILAYCSWHLIERQALRLKPGRRRHPKEEHGSASSDFALQSPR